MPDASPLRQQRNLRLKISVHEDEKRAAEKAAELEGISLSRWARARLFGNETSVSSLFGALTEGQERSQIVVLLALIAARLDELSQDAAGPGVARGVADILLAHRDNIVEALNLLFAEERGEPTSHPELPATADLELAS